MGIHKIGDIKLINEGNVKLASANQVPYFDSLVAAIVIGVFGGLLGSGFIVINNKVNIIRKTYLNTKFKKILEACVLVTLTTTAFYSFSYLKADCIPADKGYMNQNGIDKRMFCDEGYYSPLGSLFFNTQLNSIKTFMAED